MKFYNDFNAMFQAQSGLKKDMSVFNRYASSFGAIDTTAFEALRDNYAGDDSSQLSKILDGVGYLLYRYYNAGECLNQNENYDAQEDLGLQDVFGDWLSDMGDDAEVYNFVTCYADDLPMGLYEIVIDCPTIDDFQERADSLDTERIADALKDDSRAFSDWLRDFEDLDDSYGDQLSRDIEEHNKFNKTEEELTSLDPRTSVFFDKMRDADTSSAYASALGDLVSFVRAHASEYDGFQKWQFNDIPNAEVKDWFVD